MRSASALVAWPLVAAATAILAGPVRGQQSPIVREDAALEAYLARGAKIRVDLPPVGYTWEGDPDTVAASEQGALDVGHRKVIYYFVHWGPIEVPEVTETYVRERIPRIWPSEGLDITKVEPTTVAGHPALYAEVMPKRTFYRAFFMIWNCEQTGRQFIADMNYNVSVGTPRSELEAEIDATTKTLACHPGAPTTALASHPVRYDNPRYRLRLDHPRRWFVFDNPYGVPHPAYEGLRGENAGSILAWLQDAEVRLRFEWQTVSEVQPQGREVMGGSAGLYKVALATALGLKDVDDFAAEEMETLRLGTVPVLKVTGTAVRSRPEEKGQDPSPKTRTMVLVARSKDGLRRLTISVQVDYYRKDGLWFPPDRSILDTWAASLARGLGFLP